ncbi:MBL fold metallo-hydrolase [Kordiimonas pumila]|uniref:MBL fold metallo-hydrolase n=1 Tax=Kordiimonas pumila TaxID=2161677 RepID=A0ABV7D802_9PROT|nr:MBL fold metallo-hydrolase [Kordiimonas pumila]
MEFKQDFKADYGIQTRMSGLISRVLCQNPSPYTYTGTGTYIVGANNHLAVIDPGPIDTAHGEALLRAVGKKSVSHILVTHTHQDHSPLSRWLAEKTGAKIFSFGPHGAGRKAGLDDEEVEAGADKSFTPDIHLKDGDIIHGDGWTLRALHTPGHTANHMCFALQEENTIFVGDHIMAWATTVISPPDGDMRDYLASLKKIAHENADRLVPTHGPWVENPAPFIRGIITHRKMREGQILRHLEDGPMTIDIMVERMYKDVDPRLHGAAARSVLGHLIALCDENRITCDGPISLSGKFSLS